MDSRPHPSFHNPAREKRAQKHQHFMLTSADEALVAMLPPEQQAALRSEGSYAQRAEQMGVAIGTVRSRLHRARNALVKLRQRRDEENSPKDTGPSGQERIN
jgi:DNA-directed RNA polymerase specialized sigma24 family protein